MIGFEKAGGASLLQQIQQKQNQRLEQLSTGKRVNQASDDAAAQQIINSLSTQIDAGRQAISNAYDGISLSQIADAGLSSVQQDVGRIRELASQAGNGILSATDKTAIQKEITQLQDNIRLTSEQTTFAGKPLLSKDNNLSFQIGSNSDQQIEVATNDVVNQLNDILNIDITNQSLDDVLKSADEALERIGTSRAEYGAAQNSFENAARIATQADVNLAAARSRIEDTDYAKTASEFAANEVLAQATTTIQAQANQQKGSVLSLLS